MKLEVEQVIAHFRDMPSDMDGEGLDDILEMLWYYHTRCLTSETDEFAVLLESVTPAIKALSRKRQSILLRRITDLCEECERVAFAEGIRVGVQLILELSK